ncbi:MAG: ABC transporter permease [Halanaerobiales bacterium]|nr:ABC transporter permease [Halanaerobiales bacterium]
MRSYILQRFLLMIPILIGVSLFTFFLSRMAPGDPLMHYTDPDFTQEMREEMMEKMGLNKPIYVQYISWLREALKGNLGVSLRYRSETVVHLIREKISPTIALTLTSLILAVFIAIPIGIYSAVKQYSIGDYIFTLGSFLGISVPSFFLALGLIYIFSLKLRWFPMAGMQTIGSRGGGFIDILRHLVLPVTALTLMRLAAFVRYSRGAMLEVISQDYIRTARSKGVTEKIVIFKHALRNAAIPIVTMVGMSIARLFSGALIVETVFSWPGLGKLSYEAVLQRDYPVLMGTTLLVALMVVVGNMVADITYSLIDPQIRYD